MNTFVRIFGIASKKVEKLLYDEMGNWPKTPNSCILFVDFSDFDIPIGTKFTLFAEDEYGNVLHNINGSLVQVTQSFLKPFDEIPKGHKTVCEIELDAQSVSLLRSKLPTINSWYEGKERFLLGTNIF
jgi:hypothetical protein